MDRDEILYDTPDKSKSKKSHKDIINDIETGNILYTKIEKKTNKEERQEKENNQFNEIIKILKIINEKMDKILEMTE